MIGKTMYRKAKNICKN